MRVQLQRKITVDEFISTVTAHLGIDETASRSATGGILKMLSDQLDDSTFGALLEKIPGADVLVNESRSAASAGGRGLMGSLTSMAGSLLGDGAAGVAQALGNSGISLDKASGFISMLVIFLKEKLGDDMFATIASSLPGLLSGGDDD